MTTRVGIVVLAIGLLWAPPAPAATVSYSLGAVTYEAAPGESNRLDVRFDGTAVVFTEIGAPTTVLLGVPCVERAPGVVACDATFATRVNAMLGDGNDVAVVDLPSSASIGMGAGDDALTIATTALPGAAMLDGKGGPGDDRMTAASPGPFLDGEAGGDTVTGSPGVDSLTGGDGGDIIDAGDGDDSIFGDYGRGGDGRDTIDAGAGTDYVVSGGDDDTVLGGAGNDRLIGSSGNDRLDGGDGDDALECRAGKDAAAPGVRDRVHLDCETIEQQVACPRAWRPRCRVSGTLRRRDSVLGSGAAGVPAGKERTLRVPVSAKGKAAVRRARRLEVRLEVAVTAGDRRRATSTRFSLRTSL